MSTIRDPLFSVEERVALVTGATGGIGRMIAQTLIARGARTYITGRTAEKVEAAVAELSVLGEARGVVGDVSNSDGRAAIAKQLSGESELHILVNNAGQLDTQPFDEVREAEWDAAYSVNVKAAFFLSQALIASLRRAATPDRPATIIHIGSVGGMSVRPVQNYAYQSSKAAVHHLTRGMAKHLGSDHITVNAIAPGTFPSAMTGVRAGEAMPPRAEAVLKTIPRGRFGEPDDIGGTILFLASRAGAFVTGAIIPVDGGLSV